MSDKLRLPASQNKKFEVVLMSAESASPEQSYLARMAAMIPRCGKSAGEEPNFLPTRKAIKPDHYPSLVNDIPISGNDF